MRNSDMILGIGVLIFMAGMKKAAGISNQDVADVVDPLFHALPVTMVVHYTPDQAISQGSSICGGGYAWEDPEGLWHALGYAGVYGSKAEAEEVLIWGNC